MLTLSQHPVRLCDGLPRREWLRLGALSVLGVSLAQLLGLREAAGGAGRPAARLLQEAGPLDAAPKRGERETAGSPRPAGRARSCILLFMQGGISQLDTFDPKPDAPEQFRGAFGTIRTANPDLLVSEHLPRLAACADKYAVVRSVHYQVLTGNHSPCCYHVLTGRFLAVADALQSARRSDFPSIGAVLDRVAPAEGSLPTAVHIPRPLREIDQIDTPGQYAGWLGSTHEPFLVAADPNEPGYEVPGLELAEQLSTSRLSERLRLVEQFDAARRLVECSPAMQEMRSNYERAYSLIVGPEVRRAMAIDEEPAARRDRYGRNRFGQSCLLARRLVEHGARLVSVHWPLMREVNDVGAWDIHLNAFERMRSYLLPPLDQGFSALLEDLDARGLLDETLVVCLGEFGRTPRVGSAITAGGANASGRDHWPHCFSVVLAGGGIRGGRAYGASDQHGGYPARDAVSPRDVLATIYHALGVDPHTELRDPFGQPHRLADGQPLTALLG